MLKQLYDFVKKLLVVAHEAQQNKTEIKELRQELKDLTAVVQRLAYEVHRVSENEAQNPAYFSRRLTAALKLDACP